MRAVTAVLIANRGEIAVRVVRACRDAGLRSIAVYAEPDRDALHVAARRRGVRARRVHAGAETYLASSSSCDVARRAGRRRGPPRLRVPRRERRVRARRDRRRADVDRARRPTAIDALGDKVTRPGAWPGGWARRWCRGPTGRSAMPPRSSTFADAHGLPVAIKAAFGGGGRGLKVARDAGGGRRALRLGGPGGRRRLRPRRVLRRALPRPAPARRDAVPRRLPRRRRGGVHPRLLAAAAAPEAGGGGARAVPVARAGRTRSARRAEAILREAGYVGRRDLRVPRRRGRLGVLPRGEHPAAGRAPRDRGGDRHRPGAGAAAASRPGSRWATTTRRRAATAMEFRINGEDPGRGFLPVPGPVTAWEPPGGTGRASRLRRRRRLGGGAALRLAARQARRHRRRPRRRRWSGRGGRWREFAVEGLPTVLPFHRAVVARPRVRSRRPGAAVLACTPAGSRSSGRRRRRRGRANPAADARDGRARARRRRGRRAPARGGAARAGLAGRTARAEPDRPPGAAGPRAAHAGASGGGIAGVRGRR